MAVLTDAERDDAARKMLRQMFVDSNTTAQLDSVEVRQLLDDADSGIDANAAAINQWFRVGLRTKATMEQKALAIAYAAMKRGGVI